MSRPPWSIVAALVLLVVLPASRVAGTTRWRSSRSASSSPTSASRTNGGRASARKPPAASPRCRLKPGGGRPRLLFWPEAAVTDPLADARDRRARRLRRSSSASAPPRIRRPRRTSADRRHRSQLQRRAARRRRRQQHLRARPGRRGRRPLRQGAPRPLRRISADAAVAVGDRPVAARPRRPRLRRRARARARSILPGWGKVGFQLCYEIIFSGEVVDRRNRPDFIFNPSNDAWFGRWGPPQHLAQARLRAAEEGHAGDPLDPDRHQRGDRCPTARWCKSLPWRTAGVIDGELPPPALARPCSPASAISSRCCSASRCCIARALRSAATRRYRRGT